MPLTACDSTLRTVDVTCAICGHVATAVPLATLIVLVPSGSTTEYTVCWLCPACGRSESFTTTLTVADTDAATDGNYPVRAQQATLVRALCTALGIPQSS